MLPDTLNLNTHNVGKLNEYSRFFAEHGINLESSDHDLREVKHQDKYLVMAYKLMEVSNNILVDDTSLDIDGFDVGTDVRWVEDKLLNTDDYVGRRCRITVLLGMRKDGLTTIYSGMMNGVVVKPSGKDGFGFDPCILPDGCVKTLAEHKPDNINPRRIAVYNLVNNINPVTYEMLDSWTGEYQG